MPDRSGPMTRAQRFQWFIEKGLAEGVRRLPAATDERSVREIVAHLESRFEVLRTTIEPVAGALCQRVHPHGSPLVAVDLDDGEDPADRTAELAQQFARTRQGIEGEFLTQFHLLRTTTALHLALVADNVAVDAAFHSVVEAALDAALGTAPATTPTGGRQPVDVAAWEAAEDGVAERSAARRHLRTQWAVAPPRLHPVTPSEGAAGRYHRTTLDVPDADGLFALLCDRTAYLPSTMALTAFLQLICWRCETDVCSVNVSLANRHTPELRRILGAAAQRTPITFECLDVSSLEAAAGVAQVLSATHPALGRYDPFDYLEEKVHAQHRRGVCLTPDLAFNFVPASRAAAVLARSTPPDTPTRSVPVARTEVTAETSYDYAVSFSVRWTDHGDARLGIHADSACLDADQAAALLEGIHTILARGARGVECSPADVAAEVGLRRRRPPPRSGRVGRRRVDLEAIERCLLRIEGVVDVQVTVAAAVLTARVARADGSCTPPPDLREALLRAVDNAELLIVPVTERIHVEPAGDVENDHGPTAAQAALLRVLIDSDLVAEPDLDLCFVRAGGRLDRYPVLADGIRAAGFTCPDFRVVSGMSTLRSIAARMRPVSNGAAT